MAYPTPEAAAMSGADRTDKWNIFATIVGKRYAALLVDSTIWGTERVVCVREDDGWEYAGSGAGRTSWTYVGVDPDEEDDADEPGVLVCWSDAEPGATAVRITFHGSTVEVPVTRGYWLWMVEGIREAEMDDPADFEWLF